MSAERRDIRFPAVTSDLNQAGDTLGQVRNKIVGVAVIPLACQMRDNQLRPAVNSKKGEEITAQFIVRRCATLADANTRPKLVKLNGLGLDVADNRIMETFALLANRSHDFKHGVFIAAAQSGACPDSAAFGKTAHDLDDFDFVQAQADEPALLIKGFAASWIEATETLHRTGAGFETAEFLDFSTTA
jgi:hypothetical protein